MPGIVLHDFKAVYWPVPKCACTALKKHFYQVLRFPEMSNSQIHSAPFEWTDTVIDGYVNFAFVRNPYARIYSLWMNKIAGGHPIGPNYVTGIDQAVFGRMPGIYTEMPFREFVFVILQDNVRLDPHWAPQHVQFPGDCLCFRLEDYGDLLQLLLPVENASLDHNWKAAYDPELQAFVYKYYQKSFERFGYSYDF